MSGWYQEAILPLSTFEFTGDAATDLSTFLNAEGVERELEDEWTAAFIFAHAGDQVRAASKGLHPEILFSIVRDYLATVASMPVVEHDAAMARIALTVLDQFVGEWRKRGTATA